MGTLLSETADAAREVHCAFRLRELRRSRSVPQTSLTRMAMETESGSPDAPLWLEAQAGAVLFITRS